jgi:hypothetical protein
MRQILKQRMSILITFAADSPLKYRDEHSEISYEISVFEYSYKLDVVF